MTIKRIITREDLKKVLIQIDEELEELLNLKTLLFSEHNLEKNEEMREKSLATLARLTKNQRSLEDDIKGISDLLNINLIEIIIKEEDKPNL